MTDFDREPGSIDDPSGPGGQDVGVPHLPPGDTADDTGAPGEPKAADLDLPGPDDPVAWNYVEEGTTVVGPNGDQLGTVAKMVGTEEGIFHGVAVNPTGGGPTKLISGNDVTRMTPSEVDVSVDATWLRNAEEYVEPSVD